MRLIFIRHGATAGNCKGQYIGKTDEPLCVQSVTALRATAETYPSAALVVCSPMRRCLETAQILYAAVPQIVESDLRECDFGQFEGKTYEQLRTQPAYQTWLDSGGACAFPGGESRSDFCARCTAAFRRMAPRFVDATAFVVHGGVIMALMETYAYGDFYDWQVKNGGGFTGAWDGQHITEIRPLLNCNRIDDVRSSETKK